MTTIDGGERSEDRPCYTEQLRRSHEANGSMLCLGIDPGVEYLPDACSDSITDRIAGYYAEILSLVKKHDALPGAFKPNIGFFSALDRPRSGEFGGSTALARILDLIRAEFPGTPIILDAKRGDIARSSTNYGYEAFRCWQVDAVTASPYMGHDSVMAILAEAERASGLVYVLAMTSNPGARQFQSLELSGGETVSGRVADAITGWHRETGCCGAVVGATHPGERDALLRKFGAAEVPVLIPGVGTQGGRGADVRRALAEAGYPAGLARVNISSAITHPWREAGAPADWYTVVGDALATFCEDLA